MKYIWISFVGFLGACVPSSHAIYPSEPIEYTPQPVTNYSKSPVRHNDPVIQHKLDHVLQELKDLQHPNPLTLEGK